MKPNFKSIDIYAGFHQQNGMEWQQGRNNHFEQQETKRFHLRIRPLQESQGRRDRIDGRRRLILH